MVVLNNIKNPRQRLRPLGSREVANKKRIINLYRYIDRRERDLSAIMYANQKLFSLLENGDFAELTFHLEEAMKIYKKYTGGENVYT